MSGEQHETRRNGNGLTAPVQPQRSQWPEQVMGAKYVRLLEKQLRGMRDETGHGNRRLFLDDVFVVYLLAFFNPVVRSLRTVEDLSQTRQAQKHLSVERICKSTLSDFNRFIEPEPETRSEHVLAGWPNHEWSGHPALAERSSKAGSDRVPPACPKLPPRPRPGLTASQCPAPQSVGT